MRVPKLRFKADDGSEYNELNEKILGDVIISIRTGLNPRKFFQLNTPDAKNYYVTIREIHNSKIEFSDQTDKINDTALVLCNGRSNLEIGDVLFSGTGTIGEVAIVKETPNNWNIKEGIYALKPNKEIISSEFLLYLLDSPYFKACMLKRAVHGTMISIPMKRLCEIPVFLPSIPEQKKIGRFFSALDQVINKAQTELEAWKKQKQGMMQKLFSQEIRFKEDDGSEYPEWEEKSVADFTISHKQGYYTNEPYVEQGIKLARVSDLFNPKIDYSGMPMVELSDKDYEMFKVSVGDFLIARSGSIGRYGIVAEIPDNTKVIFGSFLIKFNFDCSVIYDRYFGEYYGSTYAYKQLLKITQAGANVNINAENVEKIIVPVPCLEEQRKIADCLSAFDSVIDKAKKELEAYKLLKEALMQQMFV